MVVGWDGSVNRWFLPGSPLYRQGYQQPQQPQGQPGYDRQQDYDGPPGYTVATENPNTTYPPQAVSSLRAVLGLDGSNNQWFPPGSSLYRGPGYHHPEQPQQPHQGPVYQPAPQMSSRQQSSQDPVYQPAPQMSSRRQSSQDPQSSQDHNSSGCNIELCGMFVSCVLSVATITWDG